MMESATFLLLRLLVFRAGEPLGDARRTMVGGGGGGVQRDGGENLM